MYTMIPLFKMYMHIHTQMYVYVYDVCMHVCAYVINLELVIYTKMSVSYFCPRFSRDLYFNLLLIFLK